MENLENNVVNNEVQDTPVESTENEVKIEKTFTQEEVNAMIEKRIAREAKKIEAERQKAFDLKLKAELEESEKLAKMNEADRVKAKAEKERKQFEEEKRMFAEQMKAFEQQKIKNQTMQMLGERNMPVELAQFIVSENADEIMDNVNVFQKHFNEAVEKVVTERLRGAAPKTTTLGKSKYTLDSIKNMTTDEINRNWEEIVKYMR